MLVMLVCLMMSRLRRVLSQLLLCASLSLALAACETTESRAPDLSAPAGLIADSASQAGGQPETPALSPASTPAQTPRGRRAAAQQPRPDATHYIEFRARDAQTYGHTYVMFGELDAAGQVVTKEIAGLHPASESPVPYTLGHFVPVAAETGPARGDGDDQYLLERYRLTVSKERYEEVAAIIRELQASSPVWHAVLYNCNAFVGDIATRMGLRAPAGSVQLPQDYINELRRLNAGN